MNLLELFNFHGFCDIGVVNIFGGNIVALLTDLLLSNNHLAVSVQAAKAELSHNEWVIVGRDPDHTKVRSFPLLFWWGKVKFTSDQIVLLLVTVLVKDDLVHGLGEVHINLIQKSSGIGGGLASESLSVLSHLEHAVGLVGINFGNLMLGHVVNVVIVFDQGISLTALLMSSGEATCEDLWVLVLEVDEDSCKADLLTSIFPETFIAVSLGKILHDAKLAPVAEAVFVFP